MSDSSNTILDQHRLKDLILGSEVAFEEIYKNYFSHLRNYSISIVGNAEVASDIVQNIFVHLWENRKKLNSEKSLRNYLLSSVRNNSLRHLNREFIQQKHKNIIAYESNINESPKMYVESDDSDVRVSTLLEKLSKRSRQVTIMSRIEEKENLEIANELNISVRTVETILYKSMKKLRELAKS